LVKYGHSDEDRIKVVGENVIKLLKEVRKLICEFLVLRELFICVKAGIRVNSNKL